MSLYESLKASVTKFRVGDIVQSFNGTAAIEEVQISYRRTGEDFWHKENEIVLLTRPRPQASSGPTAEQR
ncbi:MAG: hypothetical protein ACLP1Y_09050 [Candidatus Acidiferrales bacterium]